MTRAEERFYESRRFAAWDALRSDLRYAIATLRRDPGVVAVLVACLGLGIAVNATIFGIFKRGAAAAADRDRAGSHRSHRARVTAIRCPTQIIATCAGRLGLLTSR